MEKPISFLNRLPVALDPAQRIAFEGIGLACDIIDAEMQAFRDAMTRAEADKHEILFEAADRLALFRAVWSMIDALDVLRQLLHYQRQNIKPPLTETQLACLAVGQIMRNGMDHPIGSIQKLRNSKTAFPLYGILSFVWNAPGDVEIADGQLIWKARSVAYVAIGSTHHPFSLGFDENCGDGIYNGWGNPRLHAADKALSIDDASSLPATIRSYSDEMISRLTGAIFGSDAETMDQNRGPLRVSVRQAFEVPHTQPFDNHPA